MRIGIVGLGIVGGACQYGFQKLGHSVRVHDIRLGTTLDEILPTEIAYICVPTPSREDGSCDTLTVETVVRGLADAGYKGVVAIKSTVTPGTTNKLLRETGLSLCFVPEFLRERCAVTDFTENHDLLAVGAVTDSIYEQVVRSHGDYPKATVKLCPTEAELLKYYSNVFNAARVVFANCMYEVCQALGCDYDAVKRAFVQRGTTTDMYLDVNQNFRGYGGTCLPKDTKALAALAREKGLDVDFFSAIDAQNSRFQATVLPGMRP